MLREAHAAARLNHPGIVTLYELGEEDGRAFLVSELIDGSSLREAARAGELVDYDVAGIGADLCAALAHAHERGVVHRDVKPDNVIVASPVAGSTSRTSASGRAKLMDFGIAELADEPGPDRPDEVVGTLAYMAPEVASGDRAGPASDVYSLALTLFECWTGENPTAGPTTAATARRIGRRLPPLVDLRPDLPPDLGELIDSALSPDPALRPDSIELRSGLLTAHAALGFDPVPEPLDQLALDTAALASRELIRGAVLLVSALVPLLLFLGGLRGGALLAGLVTVPAALMISVPGAVALPALAPLAGLIGAPSAFCALASTMRRPLDQVAVGACGFLTLCCLDAALAADISPVSGLDLPSGWSESLTETATALIGAMLAPAAVAIGAVWVASPLALAAIARSRQPALGLIGAVVWAASVIAIHRSLALAGEVSWLAPSLTVSLALAVTARSDGFRREVRTLLDRAMDVPSAARFAERFAQAGR